VRRAAAAQAKPAAAAHDLPSPANAHGAGVVAARGEALQRLYLAPLDEGVRRATALEQTPQAERAQRLRLARERVKVECGEVVLAAAHGDALPSGLHGGGDDLALGRRDPGRGRERLGDAGIEAREPRQHFMTHDVTRVDRRRVGHVLAELDAACGAVGADLVGAQAEQRPRESGAPLRALLARPHPYEPLRRGVLRQPVHDGLGLVVAVVRGRHDRAGAPRSLLPGALVAQFPGARLEVGAAQAPLQGHDLEVDAGRGAGPDDDLTVACRIGAPQAIVHVQRGEPEAEAEPLIGGADQGQHGHRIRAAGEHEEDALAAAHHVAPRDERGHPALHPQNERVRSHRSTASARSWIVATCTPSIRSLAANPRARQHVAQQATRTSCSSALRSIRSSDACASPGCWPDRAMWTPSPMRNTSTVEPAAASASASRNAL